MARYKLVLCEDEGDGGEIVVIGYFKTERDLQQWAEDNLGEIDNE